MQEAVGSSGRDIFLAKLVEAVEAVELRRYNVSREKKEGIDSEENVVASIYIYIYICAFVDMQRLVTLFFLRRGMRNI